MCQLSTFYLSFLEFWSSIPESCSCFSLFLTKYFGYCRWYIVGLGFQQSWNVNHVLTFALWVYFRKSQSIMFQLTLVNFLIHLGTMWQTIDIVQFSFNKIIISQLIILRIMGILKMIFSLHFHLIAFFFFNARLSQHYMICIRLEYVIALLMQLKNLAMGLTCMSEIPTD